MAEKENSSNLKDAVEITTELVKAVPIYQDLLQPATKEVGVALGTVAKTVNIALAPIAGIVWSYESIQEYISSKVSQKLKNTPATDIQTPRISVAGPALEALRFAGNEEELKNLYANLLANAIDKNRKNDVHPSFVEIIKQLLPQEAVFLKYLSNIESYPMICSCDSKGTADYVVAGDAKLISDHYDSILTGSEIVTKFEEVSERFKDSLDIRASYDNFKRLNLLEVESYVHQRFIDNKYGEDNRIILEVTNEEILQFTSFGSVFIKTCVINKT